MFISALNAARKDLVAMTNGTATLKMKTIKYKPTKYKDQIKELKEENQRLERLLARAIIQLTILTQKKRVMEKR